MFNDVIRMKSDDQCYARSTICMVPRVINPAMGPVG